MEIDLSFAQTPPDPEEYSDILSEYYAQIVERLMNVGGPKLSIAEQVESSLAVMDQFMPPKGGIVLGRDTSGYLLACGSMRMLDDTRAELKRLYVRDIARGLGLGRRIIEMRVERARELGARTILADTVRGNSSMLALYDRLGFTETERYPGNSNPTSLDPYLVYRKLEI